jgi:peptidoglycan hydrolase-like amidase
MGFKKIKNKFMRKHIHKNVVLVLLLLLAFQLKVLGQDYTQKVIVKLYDPFNEVPIAKASVDIDLRVVEVLPDGSTYMHALDEREELNITGVTNSDGVFEAIVSAHDKNSYVTVRASKKGYATMINMATRIKQRIPASITIEMLPDADDPGVAIHARTSGQTLDEFVWKQKLALEEEKIEKGYFFNADEESSKEDATPQNTDARIAAACVAFTVPTTVRVTGLVEGYSGQCGSSGYTGNINFDDYIAGVISKEMGSGFPTEALKAQAVAARTFSLNNIENGRGANCGHAYTSTIPQKCIDATKATSGVVVIYNNNAISAYYSARCHGDYTRSASIASCALGTPSGAAAYCKSVACSGHANCTNVEGGSLCCTKWTEPRGRYETVFGHGVGMCQRGAQGFANNSGWGWEQIIRRFYSNISLSCGKDCPSALSLTSTIGTGTYKVSGTITASAALASNAAVVLDARSSVVLSIGFSARYANGNTFTGKLGGCTSTLAAHAGDPSFGAPLSSSADEEFKLYPNPSSTGKVIIEYILPQEGPVYVSISDMTGNEVRSFISKDEQLLKEKRSLEISTSGIRPGMYVIVVTSSQGRKSVPFLIK